MKDYSLAELEAYLDEALPAEQMSALEALLRAHPEMMKELSAINGRRDAGVHSLGEIWRRARLSCPTRQQWGAYLLGISTDEELDYYSFHLDTVGCRYCAANLLDLQSLQAEKQETVQTRRRKYFQSSVGHLHATRK